eukprot:scaffold201948_cov43-Tisochrysis_lutea.AAC.2
MLEGALGGGPHAPFIIVACAAALVNMVLVGTASWSSRQAMGDLLEAEQEELDNTLSYKRVKSTLDAMDQQAESLVTELQRMRAAEYTLHHQLLALGKLRDDAIYRSSGLGRRSIGTGDWMPHGLPSASGEHGVEKEHGAVVII